ncbi:MAG: GNAT family N-acetyltransferase [Nitriliruptorales bacterium]|nr:GNAT family N-acetyltransferase [Nitriliruptorales bacterium]
MSASRVTSSTAAATALSWLEERAGADGRWLPDATEVARLRRAAEGRRPHDWVAWFGPDVGYLGVVPGQPANVVPATGVADTTLTSLVRAALPAGGDAWIRDVAGGHPVLNLEGATVRRRLLVLERSTHPVPAHVPDLDDFDPDRDLDALVRLLDEAYAGTPDGWDRERVLEETSREGFEPADIIIARSADAPGELDGAHWTLRRDERTGEVHNLSVHPRAQGQGLARRLLDAGMARLAEQGCERVILWVDEANEAGVRLYASAGFTTAWVDALVRLPSSA